MKKADDIKKMVNRKYSEIALKSFVKDSCGCGCDCGTDPDYTIMSEDYSRLEGYVSDADLSLGCGIPTEFANIKKGDVVLDLGSGAGNDVFVARQITGEKGRVIGLDFSSEMIIKAEMNRDKLGYDNVGFVSGDIEDMPIEDNSIDVVISNCVLNLVPNKEKAFSEIYRVLKPGGHFCVSDIVINGELPEKLKNAAEMYAGCVAGAELRDKYLDIINTRGFHNVDVLKSKEIYIPDDILGKYLEKKEIQDFIISGAEIQSITVFGKKADK